MCGDVAQRQRPLNVTASAPSGVVKCSSSRSEQHNSEEPKWPPSNNELTWMGWFPVGEDGGAAAGDKQKHSDNTVTTQWRQ